MRTNTNCHARQAGQGLHPPRPAGQHKAHGDDKAAHCNGCRRPLGKAHHHRTAQKGGQTAQPYVKSARRHREQQNSKQADEDQRRSLAVHIGDQVHQIGVAEDPGSVEQCRAQTGTVKQKQAGHKSQRFISVPGIKLHTKRINTAHQCRQHQRPAVQRDDVPAGHTGHDAHCPPYQLGEIVIREPDAGKANILRRKAQGKRLGVADVPQHILIGHDGPCRRWMGVLYRHHQGKQRRQNAPQRGPAPEVPVAFHPQASRAQIQFFHCQQINCRQNRRQHPQQPQAIQPDTHTGQRRKKARAVQNSQRGAAHRQKRLHPGQPREQAAREIQVQRGAQRNEPGIGRAAAGQIYQGQPGQQAGGTQALFTCQKAVLPYKKQPAHSRHLPYPTKAAAPKRGGLYEFYRHRRAAALRRLKQGGFIWRTFCSAA